MSQTTEDTSSDQHTTQVCEFCGFLIEESGQQCMALDEGRCHP